MSTKEKVELLGAGSAMIPGRFQRLEKAAHCTAKAALSAADRQKDGKRRGKAVCGSGTDPASRVICSDS
jgi:hypothetical protein